MAVVVAASTHVSGLHRLASGNEALLITSAVRRPW